MNLQELSVCYDTKIIGADIITLHDTKCVRVTLSEMKLKSTICGKISVRRIKNITVELHNNGAVCTNYSIASYVHGPSKDRIKAMLRAWLEKSS